jgi:pimeloyl-ACP methyl ester carboxylesterase
VFGESLGGMVATHLAIDTPSRVHDLALASTLPRARATGAIATLHGLRRGFALARCLARPEHAAARCLTHRLLSRQFRDREPAETARIEQAIAAEGIRRRDALLLLAAAAGHDATAGLRTITAPTLVLCGGHDPLLTVDSQRALLGPIPDATFDVIPQSGHAITLEQPLLAAEKVGSFFFGS